MTTRIPKYRHHKGSGQALVQIDGTRIYLGKYGTAESREKFRRTIAEWLNSKPQVSHPTPNGQTATGVSINELILAYWQHAESYYVKDGKPTKELECMRDALWPLRHLYGNMAAADFGPKSLKVVRQFMIDEQDLSRGVVNHRISRLKRVFKWAVAEELVSSTVYHGLQAVSGLRFGRTKARETEPIKPVADEHVDALLPFLTPQLSAMVQVQRLCGMRPCEVTVMRPCEIVTSADVWTYEPESHKNEWRGSVRQIPIGPKAQRILEPYLKRDSASYLFRPDESEAWRREHQLAEGSNRKTPIYPCELRARAKAKAARHHSKQTQNTHYKTSSYRRAISYGLARAKKAGVIIPHWHPNQLRHSRGTEVRKSYGVEAAQVILGHAKADVTQVYAEKNLALAKRIAKESG